MGAKGLERRITKPVDNRASGHLLMHFFFYWGKLV